MRRAAFPADILGVPFVHDVAERHEIVLALRAVHAVVDGDETDVAAWEIDLGVLSRFQIFAPETGHILDDQRRDEAVLDILYQPLEIRAVEVGAGIAVVHVDADVLEAVL